jgi:hypothetical protein
VIAEFSNEIKIENCDTKEVKTLDNQKPSGFYIFDFAEMMKGRHESYKLLKAFVGTKTEF